MKAYKVSSMWCTLMQGCADVGRKVLELPRKNLYSDQICFGYTREEDEVTDTETVAW